MSTLPAPKMQDKFVKVEIDENVAMSKYTPQIEKTLLPLRIRIWQESSSICWLTALNLKRHTEFPNGYKLFSALPHGASFWARTARVNVGLPDGTHQSYFLKVAKNDLGRGMSQGEYEGICSLYKIAPHLVPRPIGWGTYKSDPDTHFFLADFIDMIEELPDVQQFCAQLANMHKDSIPLSPKGQFGFHATTYKGAMYQDTAWSDSWEEVFCRLMKAFFKQEEQVHGPCKDFQELLPALYEKVIPRLLRPLQTGGRKIKPVLIHGDIWYGNIATNAQTGSPIMFDPSVFWAHNECK
jgi:protein-ribulosamine 3-kinase